MAYKKKFNTFSMDANQIVIDCRLTTEPKFELKTNKKGQPVEFCTFGCVNNSTPGKPAFFNAFIWGKEAQKAVDMLHKGYGILIRGKLTTSVYREPNSSINIQQSGIDVYRFYLSSIPSSADSEDSSSE